MKLYLCLKENVLILSGESVFKQVYFEPQFRLIGFLILLMDYFIKPYRKFCFLGILKNYKRSEFMVCRRLFICLSDL
jgi:hypothetical protein